jgi:excinuclease ABC subunit B
MRHSATRSLLERRDVVVVASVSCIYGIGSPENYQGMHLSLTEGATMDREVIIKQLVEIQYERNDYDFHRGTFRVRGDVVEIFPASDETVALRVELFGDTVEAIDQIDPLRGEILGRLAQADIYPASHYVTPTEQQEIAIQGILEELGERLYYFRGQNRLLEAQRLEQRTLFDLEMLRELGYCHGIENYSRHLSGRKAGQPPPTLMEYLPKGTLVILDESHVAVPQLRGMFHGDRSRKEALVEYGFRLPSAFDNRPLTFEEFAAIVGQTVYVSATPGEYELRMADTAMAEQVIRPTGLMDPKISVRPAKEQVDDLLHEIRLRAEKDERVLVTTLTKRMAEDLTEYYQQMGLRVRYLHSDIDTLDRIEVIRDLRLGKFDTLIGINLLREGLDLPEVSLVAILDADKEGYLRSATSLIQTAGRAARHVNGEVIMYADKITGSIQAALNETDRRRTVQADYNVKHGITPESIKKSIRELLQTVYERDYYTVEVVKEAEEAYDSLDAIEKKIKALTTEMQTAAKRLDFERAAELRDRIKSLKKKELSLF